MAVLLVTACGEEVDLESSDPTAELAEQEDALRKRRDAGAADASPVDAATSTPPASAYPWPVWTGQVPAVPPSTTGTTYYVDGKNGSDANPGKSPTAAFATIKKAVSLVVAGDTVLIRAGLYREGINLGNRPSGTTTKPITFGSYGDGEVILDGSPKVTGWTQVGGSIWKAPVSFVPIAIVVNERPLKQVRQNQKGSTAPYEGLAGVTAGSGKWFYDAAGKTITADVGNVDPRTADVIVVRDAPAQQHVFFYGDHYTFKGLTIRGNGAAGIWGYGGHVTVDSCDIKFNGKQGVSFLVDGARNNNDNVVLRSHIYFNVLVNWPRGTNGYAEAGGGWPGAVSFEGNLRPVARGNVVHENGGEGVISYGTNAGQASGSALFEQNVIYDNWSVNLYFDNQPNGVARSNIIFNHPFDPANAIYASSTTSPWSKLGKYTVCVMLADEEWSSDSTGNHANLAGSQVYNNLIAGCRIGIRDYAEGGTAVKDHGLKNTLIANNTIIMLHTPVPGADTMGIYLSDNTSPSGVNRNTGTSIVNNLIVGFNADRVVWSARAGALGPGIAMDRNLYFASSLKVLRSGGSDLDLAGWRSTTKADAGSSFVDPQLVDVAGFRGGGTAPYDWRDATLGASSPARGAGVAQTAFSTDLTGKTRTTWNIGAL